MCVFFKVLRPKIFNVEIDNVCPCYRIFFSLAISGENLRYCYSLGLVVVVVVQKMTFCNISVITEDMYLKLRVYFHYPKSNPYFEVRQFKTHIFFFRIIPFFSSPEHEVLEVRFCDRSVVHLSIYLSVLSQLQKKKFSS